MLYIIAFGKPKQNQVAPYGRNIFNLSFPSNINLFRPMLTEVTYKPWESLLTGAKDKSVSIPRGFLWQ